MIAVIVGRKPHHCDFIVYRRGRAFDDIDFMPQAVDRNVRVKKVAVSMVWLDRYRPLNTARLDHSIISCYAKEESDEVKTKT